MFKKSRFYLALMIFIRLSLAEKPTTSAGYNTAFTQFQTSLCSNSNDIAVNYTTA
jgi:hypothetical protein